MTSLLNNIKRRLFNRCTACREFKPFVKGRSFYSKQLRTRLTVQGKLCRSCITKYKNI